MPATTEIYRGVSYSIPNNDDGVWHYKIYPGHIPARRAKPQPAPTEGFKTRDEAIMAAEHAIDSWIRQETN